MVGRSVVEVADAVRGGSTSALEQVEQALRRIVDHDPQVHAFLRVRGDAARREALEIDARRAGGATLGPLAGVAVAFKDNFALRGEASTAGSRILDGFSPPYDCAHVERLRGADAVIVGQTTMDEFAMGSSNEHSPYPVPNNPWGRDRVAGGSSGGSAAAVAASMVSVSMGSDTGGSIRQPASFCNLVGVKPSYGRVSRHGLIAFASSLDQAGPLTHTVRDAARVLSVLMGHDPRDATSWSEPVPDVEGACEHATLKGLRVGVDPGLMEHQGLDPGVQDVFRTALDAIAEEGGQVVEIQLPHFRYAVATYYVIATAEAASNLARYDGVRFGARVDADDLDGMYRATRERGFGEEVKRRIMLGNFVLRRDSYEAYYGRAQRVRTLIARDYAEAFETCDVLVSPVAPTPAFARGEKARDPLAMYLSDRFTIGANLAGLPAMSVPGGFVDSPAGPLPVGVQFLAGLGREVDLFRAGAAFEAVTGHGRRRPEGWS